MTQRELVLIKILAGVAAVAIGGLVLLFGRDAWNALDAEQAALRKQYELLVERQLPPAGGVQDSLEELKARKARLVQRFYQAGETTVYLFSAEIQRKLASFGLSVKQFSIDAGRGELSLTASAEVLSVLRFLHEVQLGTKTYDIRFFLLQRQADGACQIQMRIMYVEIAS